MTISTPRTEPSGIDTPATSPPMKDSTSSDSAVPTGNAAAKTTEDNAPAGYRGGLPPLSTAHRMPFDAPTPPPGDYIRGGVNSVNTHGNSINTGGNSGFGAPGFRQPAYGPPQQQPYVSYQPNDPLARRHSVSVFPTGPTQLHHSGYANRAPSQRSGSTGSLTDIPESDAYMPSSMAYGPRSSASDTLPALPIGAPRASAPTASNEYQSAAQWYFGGSGPTNSLSNIFNNNPAAMPPRSAYPSSVGGHQGGQFARFSQGNAMQQQQQTMPGAAYGGPSSQYGSSYDAPNGPGMPGVSSASGLPVYQPGATLTCFLVQFTSGRTDTYYIPQDSKLKVSIGDYVVVEADRGQDLGRVFMDNISVPLPRRNSTTTMYGAHGMDSYAPSFDLDDLHNQPSNSPVPSNFPKRIYRLAQPIEIESLLGKVRDEINAIAVGQYKVQEWKLPMVIIDAEYQWDRRKLTFFFSVTLPQFYPNQPPPRIDFRTLVRDLYQIYRTRIWMYCVDKDKNRANRAHNREKFLKQLYQDTMQYHHSSNDLNGGAHGEHSGSETQSPDDMGHPLNQIEWDMREVFKSLQVDVEDLTYGMTKMTMQQGQGGSTSTTPVIDEDGHHSSSLDSSPSHGDRIGGGFEEAGGFSVSSKTIWSNDGKPPLLTSSQKLPQLQNGKGSHGASVDFPQDVIGSNKGLHSRKGSSEFGSMPFFVDYGAPAS